MRTYPLRQSQVPKFLAGATTLRVPVRPQPEWDGFRWLYERRDCRREVFAAEESLVTALTFDCPYTVGSELALTETWTQTHWADVHYKASSLVPDRYYWRRAITMPAEFSRFKRRVVAVNVEHRELWEWVLELEEVK